ncbi:MAG: helix-turn-helix transcriptional regulator [Nonlabens sp.]
MNIIKVKSLPINEVLENIASQLGGSVKNECEVYRYEIPELHGEGTIQGVNFPNGLAWLQYDCKFYDATEIRFTVNEVHPLKLLYNLSDDFTHSFEGEEETHKASQFQNLIVAGKENNGHILNFKRNKQIRLNSVEIDRHKFKQQLSCDVNTIESGLKDAVTDCDASTQHYFEGPYTLRIANIFQTIESFSYTAFIRKMFLASKTYEILAIQLLDYSDSLKDGEMQKVDHKLMQDIEQLVTTDFKQYGTVRAISTKLKVPEPRLQKFFNKHYNATGNKYLKQRRMNLIVELLEETSLSIAEISKLVGIDSVSYLSKLFRERFKVSPNEYRNKGANKYI